MTRFMCRFCGAIFEKEEISKPMPKYNNGIVNDWVWMCDNCPKCKRGMDDWYVSERMWKYNWRDAVRYCRYPKEMKK